MKRQPTLADVLAPVPKGRVRVLLFSTISADTDAGIVRVNFRGQRGNCYDMTQSSAQRYVDSEQASYFNPAQVFATLAKTNGVKSVVMTTRGHGNAEKALKSVGIKAVAHATA